MAAAAALKKRRCIAGHEGHPCKLLTCGLCGHTRTGDYATRISVNASAMPKIVHMPTITAPGTEALRDWGLAQIERLEHEPEYPAPDTFTDEKGEEHDEGKKLRRRIERERLDREEQRRIVHQEGIAQLWNATASKRLSKLHRAASARTRREHGQVARILINTWEMQERGLLHAHRPIAGPHKVAQTYAEALHDLAGAYGFGFVDRGSKKRENGTYGPRQLKAMSGARAARYVGKYVSKNMRGSHGPKTVAGVQRAMRAGRTRAGGNVVYIGQILTTKTGCTARWLRWTRAAYVFGLDRFTGEIVRETEAFIEHQAAGIPLPRPPPVDEVSRAFGWYESHPILASAHSIPASI